MENITCYFFNTQIIFILGISFAGYFSEIKYYMSKFYFIYIKVTVSKFYDYTVDLISIKKSLSYCKIRYQKLKFPECLCKMLF